MPDHAHMIFTPLINEAKMEVYALAEITKAIKGASAHLINLRLGRKGQIWQEESFDHVLRSSEKLDQKIDYILNNPVRKQLVSHAEDYSWLWISPAIFQYCSFGAGKNPVELRSTAQTRASGPTRL
jgi:REP element-mobilizing transposase RayT